MAPLVKSSREQNPVTPGKISVPPEKLAEEVERIRREAARLDAESEAQVHGEAAPRFRATLCNLIIFVSHHGRAVIEQTVDNLITELCVSYPSRFFVVDYSCEGAAVQCTCDSAVRCAVSSRCVLANSGLHVCSEEVYLGVRPKSLHVVSNLLLSLLVPRADTVLLMLCDPARKLLHCWHEHAEERFISLVQSIALECDLLVYDSQLFDNYAESIEALLSKSESSLLPQPSLTHRDLNWRRTERWRQLIAGQFDSEQLAAAVRSIKRIRLSCFTADSEAAGSSIPADALLLAGWLVSCLGWTLAHAAPLQLEPGVNLLCQVDGSETAVQFVSSKSALSPGGAAHLASVEIGLQRGDETVAIQISLLAANDAAELAMFVSSPASNNVSTERSIRRVPFTSEPLESLVTASVQSCGIDTDYLQALTAACEISRLANQA